MRTMKFFRVLLLVHSWCFFARGTHDWVDRDTPETLFVETSLVFSDEFDVLGRTFHNGHGPRWTVNLAVFC